MEHTSSIGCAILLIIVFASAVAFPAGAVIASGPDLIPVSVSGPASAAAGKSSTLSSTVTNAGTQSAGYSYLYLYLSSDSTITSGDIYLGRVYVSSLSPGALKAVSASVTIPSSVAPGTYWYGAIADGGFRVAESDEENNGLASAGQVMISGSPRPDLVVTGVSAPSSAVSGSKITITPTVKNTGDASASYSYVYFYLSPDTTLDAGDTYLGNVYLSSLSSGYSKTASYSATIPQGIPGTYYVCARADGSGRVAEKDEGNNDGYSSAVSIQAATTPVVTPSPKPDLIVTGVLVPSSAVPGSKITITSTVKNTGDASASYSYVYFYLSPDSIRDAGDTYLGKLYLSSLSSGYSKTASYSATIPQGIVGTYYLCALADGSGRVAEKDEGNNDGYSSAVSIQAATTPAPTPSLKPDLVAVSVDGPSAGTRGETLSVAITVRNGGTAFSGSTSSAMYLSSDTTITPADIFLGSCSVPGISAGSSASLTGTAMVPSSVPAGSYYIGVIIDSANTISEIDEGNNIAWDPSAVAITVPAPGSSVEEQIETSILSYINQERVNAGLQPLANNPTLTSVARAHSLDMKTRNFFSHSNPDGLDPFERMAAAGYTFSSAGENIAATSYFTLTSNPDDVARNFVQDMWMQSEGHRNNILGNYYTETGIGVVYESDHSSSPYGFIATQVFARPSA